MSIHYCFDNCVRQPVYRAQFISNYKLRGDEVFHNTTHPHPSKHLWGFFSFNYLNIHHVSNILRRLPCSVCCTMNFDSFGVLVLISHLCSAAGGALIFEQQENYSQWLHCEQVRMNLAPKDDDIHFCVFFLVVLQRKEKRQSSPNL